jgi:hypothetical protein
MRLADVRQLTLGIYQVHWKDGGTSLAAVGENHDGSRWLAPTNWLLTTVTGEELASSKTWRLVWKVSKIKV